MESLKEGAVDVYCRSVEQSEQHGEKQLNNKREREREGLEYNSGGMTIKRYTKTTNGGHNGVIPALRRGGDNATSGTRLTALSNKLWLHPSLLPQSHFMDHTHFSAGFHIRIYTINSAPQ